MTERSLNGDSGTAGRRADGKFAKGNKHGRGNPFALKVHRLRAELYRTVTTRDIRQIGKKLLESAKGGDLDSIKELLNRLIGRPPAMTDLLEQEADAAELDVQIQVQVQRLISKATAPLLNRIAELEAAAGDHGTN